MKFLLTLFSIMAFLVIASNAFEKADCQLPVDVGPCRSRQQHFYYDSESKSCKDFFYGGCQGNNNRFNSVEECQKACL